MADTMLWIYPWDVVDEGIGPCMRRCADEIGVDTVAVAGLYHSGKFVLPRNPRRRVYFPEPGVCYFRPDADRYASLAIKPLVSRLCEERDVYREIREAAAAAGLRFQAWLLGFHNTALGTRHPDACIENAYGDRYPFALCPANPDALGFVATVVADVAENVAPDSLFLETHNYLNFFHGFHHEYTPVPSGDVDRFLLSLCFCDHCTAAGAETGVDTTGLRAWVRESLDERLNRYREPDPWTFEDYDDLLALLDEREDLAGYVRARELVVGNVTRTLAEAARERDVPFDVMAALFSRPSARAWMEGTNLREHAELVDGMAILAYHVSVEDVVDDAAYALGHVPAEKLRVGLNVALPDTPSLEVLEAKALGAAEKGARSFGFYNYGFLNEPRIEWLAEVVAKLEGAVGAGAQTRS